MKRSVLVVAHNEERYIGACLESLVHQTMQPDEIVVVAHNCTDSTEEIVSRYEGVRCVSYQGPHGVIYARIKGFESVTGDVIFCTDADTVVPRTWVEKLSRPFANEEVAAVSGVVAITGVAARNPLTTFWNFHLTWLVGFVVPPIRPWPMWGPSFAVRRTAYERIGGLAPLLGLCKALSLSNCADDFYLSIMLRKIGKVPLVFGATVHAVAKEHTSSEVIARARMQRRDGWRLQRYLAKQKVL